MAGALVNARLPVVPVTVTLNVSVWPASSVAVAGPRARLRAWPSAVCAPAFSFTAAGLPGNAKLGASFTALTVIVNVWAALVFTLGEIGRASCRERVLTVAVAVVLEADV